MITLGMAQRAWNRVLGMGLGCSITVFFTMPAYASYAAFISLAFFGLMLVETETEIE